MARTDFPAAIAAKCPESNERHETAPASFSGNGSVMSTGVALVTSGKTPAGTAAVTRPAPAWSAPSAASAAAPLFPSDPPTISAWP